MAFPWIKFNSQTSPGRMLRRMLDQAEESDDGFPDQLSLIVQMCEGSDPSSEANFTKVTTEYGFESNAKAKAAYDEIASAWSKLSGNGSVSDSRVARDQLFAKLRG